MNNFYPELLSELNRRKIIEEASAIHFAERFAEKRANLRWTDRSLAALGKWMVSHGERLQQRYRSASKNTAPYTPHKIGV